MFQTTHEFTVGATPFPGLLHFTLDPYLIMLVLSKKLIFKRMFFIFLKTKYINFFIISVTLKLNK